MNIHIGDSSSDAFNILVVFVVVVFIFLLTGLVAMTYCYCGEENEYTEIRDIDDSDVEMAERSASHDSIEEPQSPNSSKKSENGRFPAANNTKPTPVVLSPADILAQEIDFFVRHMDHFYATGFYCSILVLEQHMNMMDKLKSKTLRDFVRSRPEFRMRSNLLSFKLTALTPFREAGVQVSGKFKCTGLSCHHEWTSLCSFADHYQLCPQCNARVYPYEQQPLTRQEIKAIKGKDQDLNFIDMAEIAHAHKNDSLDVLSHIVSPIKPVLSSYHSGDTSTMK